MKELTKKELKNIDGGISIWAILGSLGALIFGIGVADGYVRPYKCR